MNTALLIVAILALLIDLDERRNGHCSCTQEAWDEADDADGRIRQLTDRAVINMMNEVRRAQNKEP